MLRNEYIKIRAQSSTSAAKSSKQGSLKYQIQILSLFEAKSKNRRNGVDICTDSHGPTVSTRIAISHSALLCPHSFLTGVREKPGTSAFTSRGGLGCHTAQAHAFKLPYGSFVTKPIGSKVYEQNKFGSVMSLYFQKTLSAN